MSETDKLNDKNQRLIIDTLVLNNNSLLILELKKETKLANLYFFRALKNLEKENIIEKVSREGETWISLRK